MARRRVMQAPINSIKHLVGQTQTTIVAGAISNRVIASAVVAPASALSTDVIQGAIIKAVYIEMWVQGNGAIGVSGAFNFTLEKIPANGPAMTFANSLNLTAYLNKKNILYTTQGLIASASVAQGVSVLRQWFAIPKGKQRMGLGDRLILNLSPIGGSDIQICGIYIYKEYR